MRELLYVADPMCSWCYGFRRPLGAVRPELAPDVALRLVMGGLAPDDERPMDEATRAHVQRAWRAVERRTGARFDHSFWERHRPRRSTWPACRAVLAADGRGEELFEAIQRAYYLKARDPSDRGELIELAGELGLDRRAFEARIDAPDTRARLEADFRLRDALGVGAYPSLGLREGRRIERLTQGWVDVVALRETLSRAGLLG